MTQYVCTMSTATGAIYRSNQLLHKVCEHLSYESYTVYNNTLYFNMSTITVVIVLYSEYVHYI